MFPILYPPLENSTTRTAITYIRMHPYFSQVLFAYFFFQIMGIMGTTETMVILLTPLPLSKLAVKIAPPEENLDLAQIHL